MATVFISYRRRDSLHALLLYRSLQYEFGREEVFRDIEGIEPGQRFAVVIEEQLAHCRVLVAVISKTWLAMKDDGGQRRLDSPDDYVRREIAAALDRKIVMIPVLVGGSKMPARRDLPDALQTLADWEAVEISETRFDQDFSRLVKAIEPLTRGAGDRGTARSRPVTRAAGTSHDARLLSAAAFLRRQVHRLAGRAMELIGQHEVDRALDQLREGAEMITELSDWAPVGFEWEVQLGYLYATAGNALNVAGRTDEANRYVDLAGAVFERIKEAAARGAAGAELASAINGLGNLYYQRGDPAKAIEHYRLALAIDPRYAYAWHDLFVAYHGLARQGQLQLAAMREALQQVKETGLGLPGLDAPHVARLEELLRSWERRS